VTLRSPASARIWAAGFEGRSWPRSRRWPADRTPGCRGDRRPRVAGTGHGGRAEFSRITVGPSRPMAAGAWRGHGFGGPRNCPSEIPCGLSRAGAPAAALRASVGSGARSSPIRKRKVHHSTSVAPHNYTQGGRRCMALKERSAPKGTRRRPRRPAAGTRTPWTCGIAQAALSRIRSDAVTAANAVAPSVPRPAPAPSRRSARRRRRYRPIPSY